MTLDDRIRRYLAKCPPAVSGQDGHGTTFRVACALVHGFALEPEEAFRYLEAYNAACCPPWKPRELHHKLRQAAKVAHEKARGHLLGVHHNSDRPTPDKPQAPVPVRLKPREGRFRTVRTVFSEPCVNACAHTCVYVELENNRPDGPAGELVESAPLADEGLVAVPGCRVKRPEEISMADTDWQKLDASGFADEPLVQLAAWMFGPDCTVVEAGRVMPCE